jgi:hypothetical protein
LPLKLWRHILPSEVRQNTKGKKLAGIHKLWINGIARNQYCSCPLCSGTAPGWPPNHLSWRSLFPNRFARFQVHSIPLQILPEETWKNLSEHSSKDPNWKCFYSALDWWGLCEWNIQGISPTILTPDHHSLWDLSLRDNEWTKMLSRPRVLVAPCGLYME